MVIDGTRAVFSIPVLAEGRFARAHDAGVAVHGNGITQVVVPAVGVVTGVGIHKLCQHTPVARAALIPFEDPSAAPVHIVNIIFIFNDIGVPCRGADDGVVARDGDRRTEGIIIIRSVVDVIVIYAGQGEYLFSGIQDPLVQQAH